MYQLVYPERDITDDNFTKGKIVINLYNSGSVRWNPYYSYLSMKIRISTPADAALSVADGVAPAPFLGHSFWSQMKLCCRGTVVCDINDYVHQIGVLKERYSTTLSRKDTIWRDLNFTQSDIQDRIKAISSDGESDKETLLRLTGTVDFTEGLLLAPDEFGMDQNNTFDVVADTGVINFQQNGGGNRAPAALSSFAVGDIIIYRDQGAPNTLRHGVVIVVTDNSTITIRQDQAVVVSNAQTMAAGSFFKVSQTLGLLRGNNTLFATELEVGDEIIINSPLLGRFRTNVSQRINDTQITISPKVPAGITGTITRVRKKPARRVKDFQIMFKPPFGLCSIDEYMGGDWRLELYPHTRDFQTLVVESLVDKTPGVDYKVEVKSLVWHVLKSHEPNGKTGTETHSFTEMQCQLQNLTTNTLTTKTYTVHPDSHTFVLAFQNPVAGKVTSSTRARFKTVSDNELNLQTFQMRLDGDTGPTPTPLIEYNKGANLDFTTQYYLEQMVYMRTINLGDQESLEEWKERGAYYTVKLRDSSSGRKHSTNLYVLTQFSAIPAEGLAVLVFEMRLKTVKLEYKDGVVTKVYG